MSKFSVIIWSFCSSFIILFWIRAYIRSYHSVVVCQYRQSDVVFEILEPYLNVITFHQGIDLLSLFKKMHLCMCDIPFRAFLYWENVTSCRIIPNKQTASYLKNGGGPYAVMYLNWAFCCIHRVKGESISRFKLVPSLWGSISYSM